MKKIVLCGLLLALALPTLAGTPTVTGTRSVAKPKIIDTETWLDANRILMFVSNVGNFAYDAGQLFGRNDGFYFPYTSVDDILSGKNARTAIFDGGIWIGAKTGNQIRIAVAEYSTEFGPGPMAHGTFTPDDPNYRVFKLTKDSLWQNPNQAFRDYVTYALPLGAPDTIRIDTTFFLDTLTQAFTDSVVSIDTVPGFPGDQFTWCVYTDADPSNHTNNAGSTQPLGVEIQQSAFAFASEGPLSNVEFLRFKLINRGNNILDSMFVSIWSDPDLGGSGDDLVGCDTLRFERISPVTQESVFVNNLGFCYNGDDDDDVYGSKVPAVGFDFFQGPLESTGNPADTGIAFGRQWPGYRNLPMSSFNKYINGTDPSSSVETFNYMRGLTKDGSAYTYNGQPTKYFVSGDPVTGTGDLDVAPADRRLMLSTGPFTFRPGDSAEVVCAVLAGLGGDRIQSIQVLRGIDVFAQSIYDGVPIGNLKQNQFAPPPAPAAPVVTVEQFSNQVVLRWTDLSERKPGAYPFEGYAVLQGETSNGPWDTLAVYDVKDGIKAAWDLQYNFALGKEIQFVKIPGGDNGVQRYYQTTEDAIGGSRLHNYSQYFYRVLAYSVDTTAPSGVKVLISSTPVTVTPQPPTPGTSFTAKVLDSLPDSAVAHAGISNGKVTVYIVDPALLTHHQYQVGFRDADTSWYVLDLTTGDTVVPSWKNQSDVMGTGDYPLVDGMLIKVTGAPQDFTNFEEIANASGTLPAPLPAAAGGADFAGFPTPGDEAPDAATQQVSGQRWLIHTADTGPSDEGGSRGSYSAFRARTTRDGSLWPEIIPYDFEIRFTGDVATPGVGGSYGWTYYSTTVDTMWLPFELWNIGAGTPDDPSDDYQMVPFILDDGGVDFAGDGKFDLESWGDTLNGGGDLEHSVSGGINDPYTDWIYWEKPLSTAPGTAGYDAAKTEMLAHNDAYFDQLSEVMARMVFVAWNGGTEPPFPVPMVEKGTIFRINTIKNLGPDTATFVATIPTITPVQNGGTSIVVQYDLHNRGINTIDSFYVSFWADPDLGGVGDDLVGCDTTKGLFYCYNGNESDAIYGATPPAVGLRLLQGPIVPSPGDTATAFGRAVAGYRNLGASSFNKHINGTDPSSMQETYNYMRGLNRNGSVYTFNGQPTKFFVSGKPVAGTGDLDVSPSDRRFMVSMGPFHFAPGDSQQVIVKWGVGQGADRLLSIPALDSVLTRPTQVAVLPTQLSFVAERDSQLPEAQIIRVMGFGGPLPSWSASSSQSWLQVGQTPDGVSAQLTTTSLPVGTYYDTIVVSCSLITSGEKIVPVQYQVVTNLPGCCVGTGGNVDLLGIIDLSDVSLMVAYLTEIPPPTLPCHAEANVNGRGIVDLSDLSLLVAYLTATPKPELAPCP